MIREAFYGWSHVLHYTREIEFAARHRQDTHLVGLVWLDQLFNDLDVPFAKGQDAFSWDNIQILIRRTKSSVCVFIQCGKTASLLRSLLRYDLPLVYILHHAFEQR